VEEQARFGDEPQARAPAELRLAAAEAVACLAVVALGTPALGEAIGGLEAAALGQDRWPLDALVAEVRAAPQAMCRAARAFELLGRAVQLWLEFRGADEAFARIEPRERGPP